MDPPHVIYPLDPQQHEAAARPILPIHPSMTLTAIFPVRHRSLSSLSSSWANLSQSSRLNSSQTFRGILIVSPAFFLVCLLSPYPCILGPPVDKRELQRWLVSIPSFPVYSVLTALSGIKGLSWIVPRAV